MQRTWTVSPFINLKLFCMCTKPAEQETILKVHIFVLRILERVCVCCEFNIYRYYLLYISHSFELKTPFLWIFYLNENTCRERVWVQLIAFTWGYLRGLIVIMINTVQDVIIHSTAQTHQIQCHVCNDVDQSK